MTDLSSIGKCLASDRFDIGRGQVKEEVTSGLGRNIVYEQTHYKQKRDEMRGRLALTWGQARVERQSRKKPNAWEIRAPGFVIPKVLRPFRSTSGICFLC